MADEKKEKEQEGQGGPPMQQQGGQPMPVMPQVPPGAAPMQAGPGQPPPGQTTPNGQPMPGQAPGAPAPMGAAQPMAPSEPYGAQVLRRLHEDAMLLMSDYDEMLQLLDSPYVQQHLVGKCQMLEQFLQETEGLFLQEYGHLSPIQGSMAPAQEQTQQMQGNNPNGAVTEPSPEEALQGMQLGGKSLGVEEEEDLCDDCGSYPCACEEEGTEETDLPEEDWDEEDWQDEDEEDLSAQVKEGVNHERAKEAWGKIEGALNFLHDLGEAKSFDQEEKVKAFHHAMLLADAVKAIWKDVADTAVEAGKEHLALGQSVNDAVHMTADPIWKEADEGNISLHDALDTREAARAIVRQSAKFLHRSAFEKAFGLPHRETAKALSKALKGVHDLGQTKEDGEEEDGSDIKEMVGELGEKARKAMDEPEPMEAPESSPPMATKASPRATASKRGWEGKPGPSSEDVLSPADESEGYQEAHGYGHVDATASYQREKDPSAPEQRQQAVQRGAASLLSAPVNVKPVPSSEGKALENHDDKPKPEKDDRKKDKKDKDGKRATEGKAPEKENGKEEKALISVFSEQKKSILALQQKMKAITDRLNYR